MANKAATPGTGFHGPLYLLDEDNNVVMTLGGDTALALPAAVDNDSGGTADTTDFTLVAIDEAVTGVDGSGSNAASKADVDTEFAKVNDNFATIAALLDRILDRLQ